MISRIERDLLTGVDVLDVRRCVEALGGYLLIDVRVDGQSVSELADSRHARIQNWLVALLTDAGWQARAEVSFSEYGERGRYDILAFHAALRVLLVVEVKTAIRDAQDTVGRLDVKCPSRVAWPPNLDGRRQLSFQH